MLHLFSDTENYIQLSKNEDEAILRKIKRLIKNFGNFITENEKEYITNFLMKTSNFYGLPKIHKSKTITDAVTDQNNDYIKLKPPADLKMRPTVAGPISPTHRLSNFVDLILKPLCQHVPNFIRDSIDFLNKIPTNINEKTLLVSFDVISLYTSIPHDLGLTAIEHWLDKHRESLPRPFPKAFILEAISIVLKENTFQFDDINYKQIQGTAMGTKMPPTYATLTMGFIETQLYERFKEKYGQDEKENFVKLFKRFLDDCFLPWQKTELEELHKMLNSLHPKIQFTMDILLYKNAERLESDIHYKQTDTHQYLDYHSCHPGHTKSNIPYTLARRICAIVTNQDLKKKRLDELEYFLQKQNYPKLLIKNGIHEEGFIKEH